MIQTMATSFMTAWHGLILERGLSQRQAAEIVQELAREAGDEQFMRFHQTRISKWLNDEGVPDVNDLRYLAAVAGRPARELLYYPGHPGPPEPEAPGGPTLPEGWERLAKLVRAVGGPEAAMDALIDRLAGPDDPGPPGPEGPIRARPRRGRPPGGGRR
jgi:transcriptional regulator with XRE-family HTH domain